MSHLIEPWILPPGINILIILLGIILIILGLRRTGKFIGLIGFISLWLLSTPIIAYRLLSILQNQYPLLSLTAENKNVSQLIIVLGGGDKILKEFGFKHTVSDNTLHRLDYAAYLSRELHLPILVSGGRYSIAAYTEADLMTDVLKDNLNITPKFKEDKSSNTADQSLYIQPILKENKINHVYLVTDAWHMPRSIYIFHCRGIDAIPAPMGYIENGSGYSIVNFFPSIHALSASTIAFHEYMGLLWYHFQYEKTCVSS